MATATDGYTLRPLATLLRLRLRIEREVPDHVQRRQNRDEEKHADWFESQIDAIERVGAQQYLAQQIEAGEAP